MCWIGCDMKEKILKRDKCFLSSLEREHLEKIKEWRNAQMDVLRQHKPLTKASQDVWWDQINKPGQSQYLFSLYNNNNEFIGYCGVTNLHNVYKHAEISFLVDPSIKEESEEYAQIFSDVLSMLCQYAFNSLNLERVFTETYEFRKNHISVIEQFPFANEGTLKQHVFKKGRYYNSVMHSILREEYEEL